ncbi:lipid carrier--UDP-N-acetylgalactosaminyltransferase [Nonlabens dokdonensis]|uniref:Lipid carrier--UDP-N-acetylgalactosaminyltransferase n=1 Tax=Nonlabens dokdonensis TaxID=328515 RepID=A0A1Z8APC6_9FLAO|nr:sugar transferase [Nonlabens dokdonensis]OUS12182.1 lipid carrier--UDP-N-acetylgalactosaminyltransferase [Nonlabens dokdonensis]
MYRNGIKVFFDILVAVLAISLLLPIFLMVTIILTISNSGTPFFTQLRPGRKGKIFKIIKFKTMNDKKDEAGHLLPDEKRLTKIGQIIRKTSLDELPQLLNVLKGDMSIVGPRPLLPEYLKLYSKEQARRHDVKPGITGWAQVNGRNAISWEQKFKFDVWYVDHQSFLLDLKILFKTIRKVFISEGINTSGQATTSPFKG